MSGGRAVAWRAIERVGLALFLLGFAGFVALFLLGDYRLDEAALDAARPAIAERHRDALDAALAPATGRAYDSVFAFQAELKRAIARANDRLDGASKIWDYDAGQYRIRLAKEASTLFRARGADGAALGALLGTVGLACLGALLCFLPRIARTKPGIRNDGVVFRSVSSRGWIGIALGAFLILFYVGLYFYPAYLASWILLADPVSRALNGGPASQWFLYGLLYTLAILVMGVRMLVHYRHSRYHIVRTLSVMFFQTGFAFLIPEILAALNRPAMDLKNAWPLNYSFFHGYNLDTYTSSGAWGWFLLLWGIGLSFLLVPLLAFFFGKRWYCSWVCGCGGLAETLGDPFRHLSDKSTRAWKVERWLVHGVLVFAVAMTAVVVSNWLTGRDGSPWLAAWNEPVKQWYGFLIGAIFAGVVGTGFYPFMGNRVWCRFGCPLAAILGIVQRFRSRFRITTNGGQCISCGNCSAYCEMGIDVRWYAQRGQNLARASCVGCGVCAAVCPRGVLRLENGPEAGRLSRVDLLDVGKPRISQE